MNVKNSLVMSFVLMGVWMLLNGFNTEVEVVAVGAGLSLLIAFVLCVKFTPFSEIKLSPLSIIAMVGFTILFIVELIKSNIDVALRVLALPKVKINPGIVEVKTKLKSKTGRFILANSITLTPGTLTMEIKGDSLFIHWIDVTSPDIEKATKAIVSKFEKKLEVIYG